MLPSEAEERAEGGAERGRAQPQPQPCDVTAVTAPPLPVIAAALPLRPAPPPALPASMMNRAPRKWRRASAPPLSSAIGDVTSRGL